LPIDLDTRRDSTDHRPRKQQLTETQKKAKAATIAAAAKQCAKTSGKKLIDPHALRAVKGVTYHSNHVRKLFECGEFPRPFNLSPRRIAWHEWEIDAWIEAKSVGIEWRFVKEAMGK
jgi:hypothetical protein